MSAEQIIREFGDSVIGRAQRNLGATRTVGGKKRRAVATGRLKDGLSYRVRVNHKTGVASISFGANPALGVYPSVVEYGRRPNSKMPPPREIEKWIRTKRIRARDESGRVVKQTESVVKGLAFTIARKIGREGTKPLYYMRDAVNDELQERTDFVKSMGDSIIKAHVKKFSKEKIVIK